jgi:hypothetical protein
VSLRARVLRFPPAERAPPPLPLRFPPAERPLPSLLRFPPAERAPSSPSSPLPHWHYSLCPIEPLQIDRHFLNLLSKSFIYIFDCYSFMPTHHPSKHPQRQMHIESHATPKKATYARKSPRFKFQLGVLWERRAGGPFLHPDTGFRLQKGPSGSPASCSWSLTFGFRLPKGPLPRGRLDYWAFPFTLPLILIFSFI